MEKEKLKGDCNEFEKRKQEREREKVKGQKRKQERELKGVKEKGREEERRREGKYLLICMMAAGRFLASLILAFLESLRWAFASSSVLRLPSSLSKFTWPMSKKKGEEGV
jgi:hypothetical protein